MKVAGVTGSSKGIGSIIAKDLNKRKIKVVLVARSKKLLKKIQENLTYPKISQIIAKDLRSLSACNFVGKKVKKINYLINVAGATKGGHLLKLDDKTWNDGFELKFKSALRLSKIFWPKLKKNNGKIININSKGRTTIFDFKKTEFDLNKFSTKSTTFPKIQEQSTLKLFNCAQSLLNTNIKFLYSKNMICLYCQS